LDSPRVALIRRLFELIEQDELVQAAEELIAHSAPEVVFEPHVGQGRVIRSHDELREFWTEIADGGLQVRAGAYSLSEEDDTVTVDGWVRTIDEGRLADSQARWIYQFDDQDRVVSARVERA
jgi:hypothetical protein